jgi:hypothetical protein
MKQEEYYFKDEFRDQYQKKKHTQKQAKERRRMIREMKDAEEKYWDKSFKEYLK